MSGAFLNGDASSRLYTRIRIAGFEISCAAPNAFGPGFAFGSEDGQVKFTDEAGIPLMDMPGSLSGEAVNGIAHYRTTIGVSTRQEITLRTRNPADSQKLAVCGVRHGSHGITATPSGAFLAPIGDEGILMVKGDAGDGDPVGVITSSDKHMNYYRVLAQQGREGKDLLICAARQGGIGAVEMRWGDSTFNMRRAAFPDLDMVDLCFVGADPDSPTVAAVARDGTLVLCRDMLHERNPVIVKFDTVKGRAYRLLSTRGHLFLLTSTALYGLMNLGTRLKEGRLSGRLTTPIFAIPMEAVDASLIHDRWLTVVMPDEVLRFDVNLIHDNTPPVITPGEHREFQMAKSEEASEAVESPWPFEDVQTDSRELAGTV